MKEIGKFIDLTGQTFGQWKVVERDFSRNSKHTYWICVCSCEKRTTRSVDANDLRKGKSTCCGCLGDERSSRMCKDRTKHQMCHTRMYRIWSGIKARCLNVNDKAYKNYGGRGIKICQEWTNEQNGFVNFYNDMYKSYLEHSKLYGEKETTIDRINVNGDYCKENCKWATNEEQNKNKRTIISIEFNKEIHNLKEWSEILNINYGTLKRRYKMGLQGNELFKEINKK